MSAPSRRWWAMALLGWGLGVGCQPRAEPRARPDEKPPAVAAQPESQGAAAVDRPYGYVSTTVALRAEPVEARLVAPAHEPNAPRARWRPNQRAQLVRGERLEILGEQPGWLQVRVSDGEEGFVKSEGVLTGPELSPATVLQPERLFTRPDLLALAGNRQLEPGDLVFVLRQKEQFCQVNTQAQSTAWVLCAQLERRADEIDAAKLLGRARFFARLGDPQAQALEQLARSHWSHTRLVRQLLGSTEAELPPKPAAATEADDEETISAPGAGAADEHGEVHEPADPGTASPRGYDDPAAGPPELGAPLEAEGRER